MQGWLRQAKLYSGHTRRNVFALKRLAAAALTIATLAVSLFGQIHVTHAAIACDVTLTTDSNPPAGNVGELRWAINQANANNCTGNTITFHIGAPGSTQTITFAASTPLPSITKAVLIDGTTQDAAGVICNAVTGPHPEIVLDATGIGGTSAALSLDNGSSGSEIRGLVVINAPGQGILGYTSNNTIDCNYVGLAADGTTAAGNGDAGVLFQKNGVNPSPSNNVVGGTTPAQRNVISSNADNGVAIQDVGTSNNVIEGNYIGTDAVGTAALPNTGDGVLISVSATNNTIGGTTAGAGNVISGNTQSGVNIRDSGTTGNTVAGNLIGTDKNGTTALPNMGIEGVVIFASAANNTIGGTTAAARNIISGNSGPGIDIEGAGTTGNIVEGNYIGTDINGTAALPNGSVGISIYLSATNNTIGGTSAGTRNVISGNTADGIDIIGAGTTGNIVEGNYIGTDINGTAALPNGAAGITIFASATNNTIGGTAAGARNVISGNTADGLRISGAGTTGNIVEGNYIGTDFSSTVALPNDATGITIFASATNNTIGGTTAGARNVISGNTVDGIDISNSGTTGNIVEGNYIGTDFSGTLALPNAQVGISIYLSATNNTIGGTATGARNVISGNTSDGIGISGAGTSGNIVEGNYIGTDSNGTVAVPNGLIGIAIFNSATNNTIGGTAGGARNVLSGNAAAGVAIHDAGSSGNIVEGNYIGTNSNGASALPNGAAGVSVFNSATNNTIGGTAGGARNVISGNTTDGLRISDPGTSGNIFEGNFIGVNAAGTALANGGSGVNLFNGTTGNTIGGTASNVRNLIAFNGTNGVTVGTNTADVANQNAVRGNSIFSNTGLGIDLASDGVTANDAGDADTGPNNLQNYPVISTVTASGTNYQISGTFNSAASTTFTLDFYANTVCDPSGNGQGNTYMGSTTVNTDGGGNATFTSVTLPAVGGQQVVTSTATDPGGNTSEFSNCTTGPVVSGAAPAPSFAPQEAVVPSDALTITLTSSEDLVVTNNESLTLTATITNTSSSEVDDVSIRMQAADAFDVISSETSAGTVIIDCQLASLHLSAVAPGQTITVTVNIRVDPSVPSDGEADNVLAAEYLGGRLKTAGHKVQLLRRGSLPSTGYPPPAGLPVSPAVLTLVGITLLGGTIVVKRAVGKRS